MRKHFHSRRNPWLSTAFKEKTLVFSNPCGNSLSGKSFIRDCRVKPGNDSLQSGNGTIKSGDDTTKSGNGTLLSGGGNRQCGCRLERKSHLPFHRHLQSGTLDGKPGILNIWNDKLQKLMFLEIPNNLKCCAYYVRFFCHSTSSSFVDMTFRFPYFTSKST